MRRLLLVVVFFTFLPVFVSAITVGPAKIEYRVDPGTIINDTLTIINESNEKQTFYSAFEKFTEINGEKKFLPGEPTELTNWFKLPTKIVLKPGEQQRMPFTVEVPKNAPPGGHFAVIWWGTESPQSSQVSVVTRAGILVYLRVSGEINEAGNLTLFATENNHNFLARLPKSFVVKFKNIGNSYLKPKGDILIKNIFGKEIISFDINETDIILLPNSEADLKITKKFETVPFALGFYKGELSLHSKIPKTLIEQKKYILEAFPEIGPVKAKKLLKSKLPLFIERFLEGIEITVAILGNKALPVLEIIPPDGGWFDYQNKYSGATKEIPFAPSVNLKLQRKAQNIALKIHQKLNLGQFSRIDFIIFQSKPYVLEVNTIPGLTSESLFPKAAGITFPKLLDKIVKMAYKSYNNSGFKPFF